MPMLILLSPAKTLDFESRPAIPEVSQPRLLDRSAELIDVLRDYSPDRLGSLMKLSPALSELNVRRNHEWTLPFTEENAKSAIMAFKGDVYTGLEAEQLTKKQLQSAQSSIRILSGLYGLLKPLDLIQPYRLEMGTKLENGAGKDLYQFWGSTITDIINDDCRAAQHSLIVNLASNEYYKSVKEKALECPVVTPIFKDEKNGQYKIISFYAKKARGIMARYLVTSNAKTVDDILDFSEAGYWYSEEDSTAQKPVFKRNENDIPK